MHLAFLVRFDILGLMIDFYLFIDSKIIILVSTSKYKNGMNSA